MIILFNQFRRRNSDNTKDATISVDEENNGIGLFISVDSCDDTNNKHSQDKRNERVVLYQLDDLILKHLYKEHGKCTRFPKQGTLKNLYTKILFA